ncbi:MAG: DNA polymerase III subunit epsilon [Gammaproteobacteria bacterium RIFCSPHIGHO2_12_FULL_41_15]|nr:MAG: DNA polymerase III subunit epsilon [Gammaproteobacteria bacterium RIFCSPHIGHO2_12_FULL_41_15]
MRQIILDTETTGIHPKDGHRLIEIAGVEMIDRKLTDQHFHVYLNPEREIEEGAFAVHGLSNHFLLDKPKFAEVADDLMAYIKGAELIIHNAPFDLGFMNHEFDLLGKDYPNIQAICKIFDTLVFARKKHPGQRNSLDALCSRYEIDNSHRELHGALLDAKILAEVYLAMTGGQKQLFAEEDERGAEAGHATVTIHRVATGYCKKVVRPTAEELEAHERFF